MPRFIFCADLHVRSNRPQFRTDDYWETVLEKFSQIIDLANKRKAHVVIAGDLFDTVKVGHKVVNFIIAEIRRLNHNIYMVCGQHDMSFHTMDLMASPVQTLIYTEKVHLLHREHPIEVEGEWLYGCSFGEEPVKPTHSSSNSILVIHKSITPDAPPFFLPDAISAEDALDEWEGYYMIVAGDFHEAFSMQKWGNVLVNCGPMMRSSIDQMEHQPCVWYADTTKKNMSRINLEVKPAEEVFALDSIEKKEESGFSEELSKLVETLKAQTEKPSYKEVVNVLVKEMNPSKAVKEKIKFIMGEIERG